MASPWKAHLVTRWLGRVGLLVGVLAVGGCVSEALRDAGEAGGAGDARQPITREEIDRGQWNNAYDLVRSLRPGWVRSRGLDSFVDPGQVQVYVDGTHLGDVQLLQTLPTHAIVRLEWVDPVSAAGRWGLDHGHGVILVTYGRTGTP